MATAHNTASQRLLSRCQMNTFPYIAVAHMVCPLGKEYPVAATFESPAGYIRSDLIQGLYAHTVSFTSPLMTSPSHLAAINLYPQALSTAQ